MVREAAISFRVGADLKAALESAAAADDRSVSALAERVLRAWLVKEGFLVAPKHALNDRLTAAERRKLAAKPQKRG